MTHFYLRIKEELTPFEINVGSQSSVAITVRRELTTCDYFFLIIDEFKMKIFLPYFKDKIVILPNLSVGNYKIKNSLKEVLGIIIVKE